MTHLRVAEVQRIVGNHFGISKTDMLGPSRRVELSHPRMVAMYLARRVTKRSLPFIGKRFGGRDHTTTIHAMHRVAELMKRDKGFWKSVTSLEARLLARAIELRIFWQAIIATEEAWDEFERTNPQPKGEGCPSHSIDEGASRVAPAGASGEGG